MATTGTDNQPFARRTAILLIGIGVSAFVGGMIVLAFADLFNPNSGARNNVYSASAIGHLAAAELLEELGFEVQTNRRSLARNETAGATLVLAEPSAGAFSPERLEALELFSTVVVVLPKRSGIPHPIRPDYVAGAPVAISFLVTPVLELFVEGAELNRPTETLGPWRSDYFIDLAPDLVQPQLIQSTSLTPLLETDEGILIGAIQQPDYLLMVVSDPDLIANHGLGEGDNAVIFAQTMDMAGGRTVIWDETLHGFEISENIWRSPFEPPLLAITISAALTVAILLLATTYRFGGPIRLPAAIEEGKRSLVETASTLLLGGQHYDDLMRRYLVNGIRRAAQQLNAPRALNAADLNDWLERLALARGMEGPLAKLPWAISDGLTNPNLSQARLAALVRQFHDWRTEILDGSEPA